jgi:tetratricopeptide (TPR) repeat protein
VGTSSSRLFEPTPFIGREPELSCLERRLADERLVTIAAGAGYGKTRLALRFALTHEKTFWGGIWFVDLRSASDLESACVRISRALGLADEARFVGDTAALALGRAFAAFGPALLVLDNAEHVAALLCDALVSWLGAAPELRVLVTSRAPLGAVGEDVFDLLPLDGDSDDAVSLFIDRMQKIRADYQPDSQERARIAEGLAIVGRIPLAVELYAAAASYNARIFSQASAQSGAWLSNPIAWGFARLSVPCREVLVQCSVFRGRFGHEAANDVVVLDPSTGATPSLVLARLVDRCLIQEDPETGQMWLCEGVRSHAEACLDSRPDATDVRWRHVERYAALADGALDERPRARALLESERDELEAAQELAAAARRSDIVLRLSFALDLLSAGSGLTVRQLGVLDAALERAPSDPRMVGRALGIRANALHGLGKLDEALRDAQVALSLARQTRDKKQITTMLVAVGQAKFQLGDLDGALDNFQAALDGSRAIVDYELESASLQRLGAVKQSMGDAGAAQLYYSDALDVAIDRDDEAGEMRASAGLGSFYLELGAHDRARDFYQRALLLADRLGAKRTSRIVLGYLGVLAFDGAALEEAESLLARAADRSRASGDLRVEGVFEGIRGGVLAALGMVDQAARALDLSERLLEPTPFFRTVVGIHRGQLELAIARELGRKGDVDGAKAFVARAKARVRDARMGGVPLTARSDDARIAVRILERAIERPAARRR